ncbi:FAD-dependent oxidoreductase [Planctomicrobium sp. SH668]|uniref:FAD-dependent oxidoreductase n=1 Tax=Planctomicrobium sp. SH668 TaxID=3448126 RepID=UPI003F5C00D6
MRTLLFRRFVPCLVLAGIIGFQVTIAHADDAATVHQADIIVYGGTASGIMAAVQAKRLSKSVIVLEPDRRIGGLTTGGLGATDIGNKGAIGGLSREFYQHVGNYYRERENWKLKPVDPEQIDAPLTNRSDEPAWLFAPSVAHRILEAYVAAYDIPVIFEAKLDRTLIEEGKPLVKGVHLEGSRITGITLENGQTYRGKMFIDATYEGDLFAGAGVSYTIGREANSQYNETLNGVQTQHSVHHKLMPGLSPYIDPNDPSSGLLPGIDPNGPGEEGSADDRVQAYCYRMCMTDRPGNRIPFKKPEGYEPILYELLLRNFEAGDTRIPFHAVRVPDGKTDTNNNFGFSTDFIGQNYSYPEASYKERTEICKRHLVYQQGLMWTLANHPRMPEAIRAEVSNWGLAADEFVEGEGWQDQLYIREARRMVSDYVMTEHNCRGSVIADEPVGLAAYTMDSHHVQRYIKSDGTVWNEGDVQVGGFSPYPIQFASITPRQSQCENLLVPVCLSSTHIAFGSIRMEPVFMVLGQSAATAASMAIDDNVAVQDVEFTKLRDRLKGDRQILIWAGTSGK